MKGFINFSGRNRSGWTKVMMVVVGIVFSFNLYSQTTGDFQSRATGNWSDYTTWNRYNGSAWVAATSGQVPTSTAVTIQSGHSVTLTADASCSSLTMGTATANNNLYLYNGATGYTLTVGSGTGSVTMNGSTSNPNISSSIDIKNGTLDCGSISMTGGGGTNRSTNLFISTGTVDCNSISFSGTLADCEITFSGAGLLKLTNGTMSTGGTFTCSSGTVQFANLTGALTIPNYTYNNLKLDNTSGTNTAAGAITVNGTLTTTSGGTFDMSTYQLINGGSFSATHAGILKTSNTTNPAIPNSMSWSGDVQYTATAGSQSIAGGTYGNISLLNSSGTNTATGAITVNSTLTTTSGGTFDMSTFQLIAGTSFAISNSAILKTANTTDPAIPTGKTWGGTVQYYASTGAQFVSDGTFNILTLSNTSGINTLKGAISVTGLLTTTNGTLAISSYNVTTGSISGSAVISSASGTPTISVGSDNTSTTYGGIIGGGAIALTKTGTGTLTLNGVNTYTGLTTISNGVIKMGDAAALGGTGTGTTVSSGATLDVGSVTSNAEPLTISGTGYSGITNGAALYSSSGTSGTFAGAITLGTSANISAATQITLTGGITTSSGKDLTFSGVGIQIITTTKITGAGSVIMSGSGTTRLGVASDYSGTTTVSAGRLENSAADVFPETKLVLSGGTYGNATFNAVSPGFQETFGVLSVTADSQIDFATNATAQNITFANSSAETWTGILTVDDWVGTAGTAGTKGKIFFSNSSSGLSSTQLTKIIFLNVAGTAYDGDALHIASGEFAPSGVIAYYYKTVASGNWSTGSTWQRSTDNSTWSNTSQGPTSANSISILINDNVTFDASVSIDQTTISASKTVTISSGITMTVANGTGDDLTINGTLLVSGTVTNSGAIQVNSGGTYNHGNGTSIPIGITFASGSTIEVSGSATCSNIVTYATEPHHVVWSSSSAMPTGNSSSSSTVVLCNGNFSISNGSFLANTNGSGSNYGIVTIGGDLNISGSGILRIINANTSSGVGQVNVAGNFNMTGGTLDFSNSGNAPTGGKLNVTGNFTHTGGTITATKQPSLAEINLVGTSGTQTLESTGQSCTVTFNVAGSNAQCQVLANKTFVQSANTTFVVQNGTSAPDYYVYGYHKRTGATFTTTGTMTVGSAGTYEHNCNGNAIPTATWDSGSLMYVTGITSTACTGLNQSFHHVTWACSNQTTDVGVNATVTWNGDLTVSASGATPKYFGVNNASGSNNILTVLGNVSVTGGALVMSIANASGNGNGSLVVGSSGSPKNLSISGTGKVYLQGNNQTGTLTVYGDITTSGSATLRGADVNYNSNATFNFYGNVDIATGTVGARSGTANSGYTTMNLYGTNNTLKLPTTSMVNNENAYWDIKIKNGANITLQTDVYSGRTVTVETGGILNMGVYVVKNMTGNAFTTQTSSTTKTGNTGGLVIVATGNSGAVQTATRTYSTSASYVFNGSSAQITGDFSATVANLEFDNSAGVSLSQNMTVANGGTLTLTNGYHDLKSYTLTMGTSAATTITQTAGGLYSSTNSASITTGKLTRYYPTGSPLSATGNGYFPLAKSATELGYVKLSSTANITTAGTISVAPWFGSSTVVSSLSVVDGANTIVSIQSGRRMTITTSSIAKTTDNDIRIEFVCGTTINSSGNASDLCLATYSGGASPTAGKVATHSANIGTKSSPQVIRTGLSIANLSNAFVLGTYSSSVSPVDFSCLGVTITAPTATVCQNGSLSAMSVSASGGASYSYQWYSNTSASTSGSTSIGSATSSSYTPLSSSSGTLYYYCAVTSTGSCATTQNSGLSGAIIVNALPVPSFTAQAGASACASTDVTYTTQASQTNYTWNVPGILNTDYSITSGGVGTSSNTVTLKWLTTGSKTVTINYTNGNSCSATSATSSTATTVNALPTISVQPSTSIQTICQNATPTDLSVTVAAGSGTISTYQWYSNTSSSTSGSPNAVGTSSNTYTPSTSASGTLYYFVTITNSNSCSTTSNVSGAVTVNAKPTISVQPSTSTQTICQNATPTDLSVTASAGSGTISIYQWYSNTSSSTSGSPNAVGTSSNTYTPSTSASGSLYYFVTITNSNSCSTTSNISGAVTVNTIPTISGTSPASICDGGTVGLGATASAGTINWYAAASGGSSLGTGTSYTTPSISTTTTYYVDATANSCTTGSRTAVVATVNTTPTISGTSPASICDGGTVGLGATASAGTINWYAAASGGSSLGTGTSYTTPSISTTTTYYVDATANSCTTGSRTAVVATVNSSVAGTAASDQGIAYNATAGLTLTGSTGSIQWQESANGSTGWANVTGGTGGTTASYTTANLTADNYYRAVVTNGSCTSSTSNTVTITITTSPTISTSTSALTAFSACTGSNSANQTFTVSGSNLTADIAISSPSGYEISTSSGSGFGSSITLTQSSGSVSLTTIYVRSTTGASNGASGNISCTTTGATTKNVSTGSLTINALPTATAGSALSAICQSGTSVAMGGSVGGGATGGTWSGGAGTWTNASNPSTATYTADASETGSITLTLTTSGGSCSTTTATKTITVNANPTASAGSALSAICQSGTSAAMGGSVGGGATGGTWSGGAGTWTNASNPSTATYTVDASETGSITLTLTTSGGSCSTTTATKTITVNANPTATAGSALSAICQSGTSAAMGGSVGGGATGGTWSGGAGTWTNASNPATATYTASASETGSITLTLTTSGGSCSTTTATKTITVNATPTASISYAGSPFTTNDGAGQAVSLTGTSGGTYSSTAGLTIDGSTGSLTPSSSTVGTYTVTYTIAAAGGCAQVTATTSVVINSGATTFYYLGSGLMNNTNSWWSGYSGSAGSYTGTGTHPTDITSGSHTFYVYGDLSSNDNWILGAGSKIIVGDGTGTITFTVGSSHSVTGTVDVANNATLSISSSAHPTFGTLNNGSTVAFTGSASQSITTATTFGKLTINNSNGVSITANITVGNTLTLTSGKLSLGAYTLSLGSVGSNATVTGGSASSYVVAYDNSGTIGYLKHFVNSNASYVFPIGDASNYTPLTFTLNSGTLSSAYLTAYTKSGKIAGMNPDISYYVNRYWEITPSGFTTPNYDVSYTYVTNDITGTGTESSMKPVKKSGTKWYKPTGTSFISDETEGTGSVNDGTHTLTWTGLQTFSFLGGVGETPVALPIELLYFTAKQSGTKVKLDWATASEQNNDYFVVERSQDGKNFTEVFRKKGAGNSVNTLYYNGFDNAPLEGVSYYRLKQVDYDAKFKYSDIQSVNFKFDPAEVGVKIYPNPAIDNKFTVDYTKEKADQLEVYFYNSIGQLLHKEAWVTNKGINTKEFYFPDVSEGMYILELKASDGTSVKQHIKM